MNGPPGTPRRGRKLRRWLLRLAVVPFAALLLYGAALLVLPRLAVHADWTPPATGIDIAVRSNGVHTDLVLPAQSGAVDWSAWVPREQFEAVDGSFRWVSFGWGSRDFYLETPTWADLKPSTALRALSGIEPTVLHVTWDAWPPVPGERCRLLRVTPEQLRALCDGILATFDLDGAGRPRRVDHRGYTAWDGFYEARGRYSPFITCNEWTGARLRAAGLPAGRWTPLADDVLRHLPR